MKTLYSYRKSGDQSLNRLETFSYVLHNGRPFRVDVEYIRDEHGWRYTQTRRFEFKDADSGNRNYRAVIGNCFLATKQKPDGLDQMLVLKAVTVELKKIDLADFREI